jgi:hypothetical protein
LAGLYRDIGLNMEDLDHPILRRGDSRGMEGHDFGGRQGGQADRDEQAGREGQGRPPCRPGAAPAPQAFDDARLAARQGPGAVSVGGMEAGHEGFLIVQPGLLPGVQGEPDPGAIRGTQGDGEQMSGQPFDPAFGDVIGASDQIEGVGPQARGGWRT